MKGCFANDVVGGRHDNHHKLTYNDGNSWKLYRDVTCTGFYSFFSLSVCVVLRVWKVHRNSLASGCVYFAWLLHVNDSFVLFRLSDNDEKYHSKDVEHKKLKQRLVRMHLLSLFSSSFFLSFFFFSMFCSYMNLLFFFCVWSVWAYVYRA